MTLEVLWEGFLEAIRLIVTGDHEVVEITLRSIFVSVLSTGLAALWSIPIALLVGLKDFPGKRIVKGTFNALLGVPTVALGLFFFLMLSRSGPFGIFHLLFTTTAMSIGQSALVTPILITITTNSIESTDVELRDLARTLGASETKVAFTIARESMSGIILSIVTAFNRAFAELGIVMMVGGNIRYVTRVLTTAISLQTAMGDIPFSIALAIILLLIVYSLSLVISLLERKR